MTGVRKRSHDGNHNLIIIFAKLDLKSEEMIFEWSDLSVAAATLTCWTQLEMYANQHHIILCLVFKLEAIKSIWCNAFPGGPKSHKRDTTFLGNIMEK